MTGDARHTGFRTVRHVVIPCVRLDFPATFLFIAPNPRRAARLRAADRDFEIPEVNTRQRDAPSGAFWLCVLFSSRKSTTFPGIQPARNVSRKSRCLKTSRTVLDPF
ncbi:hypothetical protein CO674_06300 [Rhizobium hidalgonense]|uniref:Uncharacterized protein n=1 Tax=Rhizobium hidalgonense TaxID=1538159 RepID=A0ABX4JXY3_9HYPH|nr:hypothetical protein CO674_06300 [Rhizobium hidalgonense]